MLPGLRSSGRLLSWVGYVLFVASCKTFTTNFRSQNLDGNNQGASASADPLPKSLGLPPGLSVKELESRDRSFCAKAKLPSPKSPSDLKENELTPSFLSNCAGCHGLAGEGRESYPALDRVTDLGTFRNAIRSGKVGMPGFDESFYAIGDLERDFKILRKFPKDQQTLFPNFSVPVPLLDHQGEVLTEEVILSGLKAWRTPGDRGACSSCHGPDPIDLARIGYSNGAILRRAISQGRTPEEAMQITRAVLATRAKYKISAPCDPLEFRPLQPRDAFHGGENADLGILTATKKVGSVLAASEIPTDEELSVMMASLAAQPLSELQLGMPFSRWTEDQFNGDEHKSTAEWIPELAMEAGDDKSRHEYNEAQSTYLESPGDENFWKLYELIGNLSAKRFTEGGVGERLSREKYRSVLLFSHMMRRGSYEFPSLAAQKDLMKFSVWETGQVATVMLQGCGETEADKTLLPCWGFPKKFFDRMGSDRDFLLRDLQSIPIQWLTAGLFLDPTFQFTELGDAQIQHWHDALESRSQIDSKYALPWHHLVLGVLKLAKAMNNMDESLPSGPSLARKPVNQCWNTAHPAIEQWANSTLKVLSRQSATLKGDEGLRFERATIRINRAILINMSVALKAPRDSCKNPKSLDAFKTLVSSIGDWKGRVTPEPTENNSKIVAEVIKLLPL